MKRLVPAALAAAMMFISGAHAGQLTGLQGVWQTTITRVNCDTGAALAPPFTSLLDFAGNGTESEATNNPIFEPGQRSTAYGMWRRTGTVTYHMNTYALILFSTDGPPPIKAGSQQIHQDIVLAGDAWTSKATVQYFDTTGTQVGGGCATASAVRLP